MINIGAIIGFFITFEVENPKLYEAINDFLSANTSITSPIHNRPCRYDRLRIRVFQLVQF
jgi:hypothetical protein